MKRFIAALCALIVFSTITAKADNVELQWDPYDCVYYVNIPANGGTHNLTLTEEQLASRKSFKVYDDGGKDGDYKPSSWEFLYIVVPEGYVLHLSGTMTAYNGDYMDIYDGERNKSTSVRYSNPYSGEPLNINTVSSGNSMTIQFYGWYQDESYAGLDCTVTVTEPNTQHKVSVSSVTGGSMVADKSTAKVGEQITVTATPSEGRVLSNIIVYDNKSKTIEHIDLNWDGPFFNTASFPMHYTDITICPVFSTDVSNVYINMPKSGSMSFDIPSFIRTLHVYDDGGENHPSSTGADGTLTLTAPEGYHLRVEGYIHSSQDNMLYVYDGTDCNGTLLYRLFCRREYNNTHYPTHPETRIISRSRSITLKYAKKITDSYEGLNLIISFVPTITIAPTKHGIISVKDDKTYAVAGDKVTFNAYPEDPYTNDVTSYTDDYGKHILEASYGNTFEFVMPETPVTLNATYVPEPRYFEYSNSEYTIKNALGWEVFCDLLEENEKGYFTGKTVNLKGNINVSRMAGSSHHDFTGTFNGNKYEITFNHTATEAYTAPFRYVDGATIKNLYVKGTINTSAKYAAGFIAAQYGATTIENCRSSIIINSSVNGDGTHGGFVASTNSGSDQSLTIEGCLFNGKILGEQTTSCGGFVGWVGHTVDIRYSIFNPSEITVSDTESASFARYKNGKLNLQHAYCITPLGDKQCGDFFVTNKFNNLGASGKTYNATAIDSYENCLKWDGKYYSDKVGLTLDLCMFFGTTKYITSFYWSASDLKLPDGAQAYTVAEGESGMEFYRIGTEGNVIPKGTAVVILSDKYQLLLTRLDEAHVTVGPNDLQGSDTDVDNSEHDKYVLTKFSNNDWGFYKYYQNTIPAGKAYIPAK